MVEIKYQVINFPNGDEIWLKDGKQHREDGPAIIKKDGTKMWMQYGVFHREDGPAMEMADGSKFWYIQGELLTEEEFNNR